MKIFVNAKFLAQPITGAQRFAIELSIGLKKLYPDIVFLAPPNIIHHDIAKDLDVKIIGARTKGIIWEQVLLPLYLMRHGSPLLINLCNIAPILYSNNLVSILDLSFHLHPEWFSKSFSNFYNFFIPRLAKHAKQVVTISEYSQNDIIKYLHIDKSKIKIINPGISDIFLNSTSKKDSNKTANKYGKYILAVSSLDPRKNFISLVQAYKEASLPGIKLLIVGSQKKIFSDFVLKDLIGSDENIVFTGYLTDEELVNLYRNALFFAYPSLFEGFGIPPLEAMACGCPTLVSNTTSLPEVCGQASLYVDPHNINDIKEGISKLASDAELRESLTLKGYEQIKLFRWSDSSQKMLLLLKILTDHL